MIFTGANKLVGVSGVNLDGHAHVFTRTLPMISGRRYTPSYNATLEDYVRQLEGNGIAGGILVQPSFLGTDNHFLIDSLKAARRYDQMFFKGVVVVAPDTSLDDLKRFSQAGVIGMRLNLLGVEDEFDKDEWSQVISMADQLGWHVEIQARGPALPKLIPNLLNLCSTIVVDHFGLPATGSALETVTCSGFQSLLNAPKDRVYIKLSAPYRVFPGSTWHKQVARCGVLVQRLLENFGTEQLLWGSDWPWTQFENSHTYKESVAWLESWSGLVEESAERKKSRSNVKQSVKQLTANELVIHKNRGVRKD